MKYHKNLKPDFYTNSINLCIIYYGYWIFQRDVISRSLITVNLGSLYVKYLNEKAEFLNYIKKIILKQYHSHYHQIIMWIHKKRDLKW